MLQLVSFGLSPIRLPQFHSTSESLHLSLSPHRPLAYHLHTPPSSKVSHLKSCTGLYRVPYKVPDRVATVEQQRGQSPAQHGVDFFPRLDELDGLVEA